MTLTTTSLGPRRAIVVALASMVLAACGADTTVEPGTDDASTVQAPATTDASEPADDSGEDDTSEVTTPATTAPMEPTATGDDAAPAEPVALPASGELDGRRVTVEAMGPTTLTFDEPDEGMEVIYLEVLVENVSAEPWNSNIVQFFLVDGDGNEIGPELLGSEAGDPLPDVDALEQGQSSTGFVPYQVPPGSPLTLSYAVDLAAGKTIDIPLR